MVNNSLNKWPFYIVAATIVLASLTKSALSTPLEYRSQLNGVSIAISAQGSSPTIVVNGEYISGGEEFQQIIGHLESESRESVALNPDNYVGDDFELDEIIRVINNHPQTIQGSLTGGEVIQPVDLRDAPIQRSNSQIEQSIGSPATVEDNDHMCAICIEPLDLNLRHSISILECLHKFHKNCIQHWYNMRRSGYKQTCPICREEISSRFVI